MHCTVRSWRVALAAGLWLVLTALPASGAANAYIKIEGSKQGAFKGEGMRKGSNQWIPVLAVSHAVQSPRDAASGQASGKRRHTPIKITKEWGAASSQLERALAEHEVLREVVIEFVRESKGQEEVYQTIKLTNALVSGIDRRVSGAKGGGAGKGQHELEEISFAFEKIEVMDRQGKTSATDQWISPK